MRLLISKEPLSRILRWAPWVLFACALSLFAWCGIVMLDAWVFQKAHSRQFDRLPVTRIASPTGVPRWQTVVAGGLIGRIEIPRLGLSTLVIEGTASTDLRRAAGHISATALPGQPGNIAIAGHRDTFFRPLRNIQRGDLIILITSLGQFRYRVVSIWIVSPNDVAVLHPGVNEILTLVTCYPFYFVGAAPERFIVRAERIEDAMQP